MERRYLAKEDRVGRYENNLVRVSFSDGTEIFPLEPRRLFPVNNPDEYITFLDTDGVERCVLRHLSDVDNASRGVILASLDDYYLVPHILAITKVTEKYGTLRWTVSTDRGEKSFDIRNRNHDIRVSKDGSVRVRDSDDNRYIIDDYHALDAKSRAALIADI